MLSPPDTPALGGRGGWMEGCGEGWRGARRGEGLRAPRSAQPLTGSASSRRCCPDHRGIVSVRLLSSPGDITHSGDVGLAQEGGTPTSSVAV